MIYFAKRSDVHRHRNLIVRRNLIMSSARPLVPAFSPPTPDEAAALALTAAYLSRAANEMASRLLPEASLVIPQIDLLATLRDNLSGSAALCECLLAVFDDWPASASWNGYR
jgi:hypothetical protein